MRTRRWRPFRQASLPGRSRTRWIVVGCGLAILVAAVVGGVGPFQQTGDFRRAVGCDDCFGTDHGSITARRTYTTTSTSTDANGNTSTRTDTHYELGWQRSDGTKQSRDVSKDFYDKATEGRPADLRIWRGEVVAIEVMGATERFLPNSSRTLVCWIYLGFFGIGVLLWGLFFGWWDGLFMLAFRTFAWMFLVFVPASLFTHALAYGFDVDTGFVVQLVLGLFFVGIALALLAGSFAGW